MNVATKSISRLVSVPTLLLVLPGCSWLGLTGEDGMFRDRQGEYLQAEITEPMNIPPELDSFTIDDLYYIPPEAPGERQLYETPPPPKPIDTRVRTEVVIQRFGDRAWIVLGATPGQVWPRLRDFFVAEGIPLAIDNPESGIMETTWVPEENTDRRNRYRVWVEPGLHAGNSEVYVLQTSDDGSSIEGMPVNWPEDSTNIEREATFLVSVSQYLADRTDIYRGSSVSMLAGSIEVQGKASIDATRSGDTRLDIRIDADRAWSQITQSLNNAGIDVIESDRDAATMQVVFTGTEEDEPGFFSRLFGGDDEIEPRTFEIDLVETSTGVTVRARVVDGGSAPYQQDLLIRTINDNLV